MKNQHSAESQVVVCKIRQPPLLIAQALLPAISFHLLRMILAISLPVVRVGLAPLPRTLQADLLIHRIGSNLLTMIIGAALALTCRLAANPLLWMITVRLKNLLTVGAAVIPRQAAPEENGRSSFSLEASWPSMMSRLCGEVSPAKSPDLSAKNRGGRLLGSAAQRNNTPCIRAQIRGLPTANDLESLQCVHFGVQETGSHLAIQGDGEAGRISGGPVLTVVLTRGPLRSAPAPAVNSTGAALSSWAHLALRSESHRFLGRFI